MPTPSRKIFRKANVIPTASASILVAMAGQLFLSNKHLTKLQNCEAPGSNPGGDATNNTGSLDFTRFSALFFVPVFSHR